MKTLTLTLPDTVDVETSHVLMMVAARLYERGTLSLGQAADLAGRQKREFAETLGSYGVSIFNYPALEIARDVNNADLNQVPEAPDIESRIDRFKRLRGAAKDDRFESLTLEDFKEERREIWQGLME